MNTIQTILFGIVVLITHFIEGITGFGCTVLALPFCTAISGIKVAVPVLVAVAWILTLYIVIVDYKNIVWKEYLKIILFVVPGLPLGMLLFSSLPDEILKKLLAVFMIFVAVRGLYKNYTANRYASVKAANSLCPAPEEISPSKYGKYTGNLALFVGGIAHGAFGSGGPFIVIYAAKALPDKSNFRATLCLLWVTLNSVMNIRNIASGTMSGPVLRLTILVLPFLAAGMFLGNIVHKKINGNSFIALVYIVLLLSGIFMLFS